MEKKIKNKKIDRDILMLGMLCEFFFYEEEEEKKINNKKKKKKSS